MKKLVFLAVVLVAIAGVSQADAQGVDMRLGGGLIFDGSVFGGGAAADIAIGDRPIAITPFFEYYKESPLTLMGFGADITYKAEIADGAADAYIGAGAGMARADVDVAGLDASSALLIDARAGLVYGITDAMGIYGEVKYWYSSKDATATEAGLDISDVGAFVGISFNLGGN